MTTTAAEPTTRPYPELKGTDYVTETCPRCGGDGRWSYGNVNVERYDGRTTGRYCFDCRGTGTQQIRVSSIRARVSRQAKAAAEAEKRAAEYAAQAAQREAERKAEQERREAEEAARHASATPCPTGRVEITGTILGFKEVVSYFGYRESVTLKMVVADDRGFKVYGSVPSGLSVEKQDRVRFTASVEQSHDDELFGWFKRPTKASKV